MSMNLSIYVGPYLECTPQLDIETQDQLTNCRLTSWRRTHGSRDYLGANGAFGLTRETTWERTGESEAILEVTGAVIAEETAQFAQFFASEIAALRTAYDSVELKWGVVPDWS